MVQAGYDYSRHWEPSTEVESQVKTVKKNPKNNHKKNSNKKKMLVKFAGIAFIYALVLVYLCIKSASLGYQIIALEQELKDYETVNARLQHDIQGVCSLDKVEEIAINDLGMHKPDKHLAVKLSTTKIAIANDNIEDSAKPISEVADKPLYKLYNNLMLLSAKN